MLKQAQSDAAPRQRTPRRCFRIHPPTKMARMNSAVAVPSVVGRPGLPFAHLNLRRNPFGEVELFRRVEFAVVDVDRYIEPLKQPRAALQFFGEKGHGKTTHLIAIMQRFPDAAYIHVGEGERPVIPVGDPLFIDEVQRVRPAERRRIYRRDVPLVFGTHRNFTKELKRYGRDVVTVTPSGNLSVGQLLEILNRRIQWARRGADRIPRVTTATAQTMIGRHGADIRAIEAAMYNIFQQLESVRDV